MIDNRNPIHVLKIVIARMGFQREGLLRERWNVGGDIQDSVFLGLLAREWRARRGIRIVAYRREHAADFVGRFYFRQDPRLLKWALTNPLDRVQYQPLSPLRKDFELIVSLMRETGVLDRDIAFEEYVETKFAEGAKHQTEWRYEPGDAHAE